MRCCETASFIRKAERRRSLSVQRKFLSQGLPNKKILKKLTKKLSFPHSSVLRQVLQRGEPPSGFASRLRRETRLQRWTHRNALASLYLCGSFHLDNLFLGSPSGYN
ncbi:hypothetical protein [Nostoc sp.]|uniref:hypothetical protein n=1 Tax=Nostoc sp. TaxID=1180 RepID=UPI002FF984A6